MMLFGKQENDAWQRLVKAAKEGEEISASFNEEDGMTPKQHLDWVNSFFCTIQESIAELTGAMSLDNDFRCPSEPPF